MKVELWTNLDFAMVKAIFIIYKKYRIILEQNLFFVDYKVKNNGS